MGQAFDERGNVLGEAYGDTKREVFDKLNAEFKNAHEIRIRTLEASAQMEMPRYESHKTVWALKIKDIGFHGDSENGCTGGRITPEEDGYAPFEVDGAYMNKHKPQIGGYYVVYADGYQSYSPAQAFEEGYTRL